MLVCFITLSGVMISKLAIDPLSEHISNLQTLSKETLHELNLPISTILTNTQMLKKNLVDDKSLRRISRIEMASSMLQDRYNELDYMIKTQTLQNLKELVELDILLKERVVFLSQIYTNVKFNLELESLTIQTDKIGLTKVIDNIIDNAIKYSKENPKVDITLSKDILTIKDYGCGIDEVELVSIFDKFYQSDKSMKGFGIGLNMVKTFCDKNKIKLSITSTPNFGTTIFLSFKTTSS